ncbi:hypothetical protein GCM10011396_38780 [Undibacterium terreum]|uniref:Uncharacterized protein n=1 Tax=Undibacterium terreum TaxID=1224302 RepID=A0A916XP85_9BURK|nr:hypothetical protein GCM10011396_38780 [Undibacterium terreum]
MSELILQTAILVPGNLNLLLSSTYKFGVKKMGEFVKFFDINVKDSDKSINDRVCPLNCF